MEIDISQCKKCDKVGSFKQVPNKDQYVCTSCGNVLNGPEYLNQRAEERRNPG